LQRALAVFSLVLIGISVVLILVIMFLTGAGMKKPTNEWELLVFVFPYFALPLGALGIIALFVVGAVERRKLNSRQTK